MSSRDMAIKSAVEQCMQWEDAGRRLIEYFDSLPEKDIRRSITMLYSLYPGRVSVPWEETAFLVYMLSTEKIIRQPSFPMFVSGISAIKFSEEQKAALTPVLEAHMERLAEVCTFELEGLTLALG